MTSSGDKQEKQNYTSPFTRDPDSVPKRWRLTERDKQAFIAIYEHEGLLTSCQLEALLFTPQLTDSPRSAKRSAETRLQYSFHKSYLDRISVPKIEKGRSTIGNLLDCDGIDYVVRTLGVDRTLVAWRPKITKNKPSSHYHSLLVNDVRIAFERIGKNTELHLSWWIGERKLKSKDMRDKIPYLVSRERKIYKKAPDGAFALEYPPHQYPHNRVQPVGFFLEVDRGTESNNVWAEKIRAYEQFRKRSLSLRHFGFKNFRVLVTVSSQKRLLNLMETTHKAGGGTYYWFTTQDNCDIFRPTKMLDDIWKVIGWEGQYSLRSLNPKST